MSPVIGTIASSTRQGLSVGSYEWIATATGTGSNTSLVFNSIPSTYTHLQIRANLTTSGLGGTSAYGGWITFNGDNGSNYSDHDMYGTGSNPPVSYNVTPRASIGVVTYTTNTLYTAANIVDIPEYTNTNKTKVVTAIQGSDLSSSGIVLYSTGMWNNTAAITSIAIFLNTGFGTHYFTTNATAHLYGIKG